MNYEPYFQTTRPGTRSVPLVVNFGSGVDSTAVLVEFVRKGIVPDLILFADTGSEKPETYEHLESFSSWLVSKGFPAVTVVSRERMRRASTTYRTIEENCLQNATLPSLAFGRKSCSLK